MTKDEIVAKLRLAGNGLVLRQNDDLRSHQGDFGLCDDAADLIEAQAQVIEDMALVMEAMKSVPHILAPPVKG